MVDYTTFSELRLSRIFPRDFLEAYPLYIGIEATGGFDTEYLGGQWHEESIDGVQFFFPARDGAKLGVVELWGSACVVPRAVRDRPAASTADLVPAWAANADRVLEVLQMSVRMGAAEGDVRALAAGRVLTSRFPDAWYELAKGLVARGSLSTLYFAHRAPDLYHVQAVVHCDVGVVKLAIFRPDVVRANDSEGGYEACTRGLYDGGSE
jgi:hypothetical protein